MKTINNFIHEKLILNKQSKNLKRAQIQIINDNHDLITANLPEANDKTEKINFIDPKKASYAIGDFCGSRSPCLVYLQNEDRKKMIDLISQYGGWEITYRPKSYYSYDYHKGIIVLTDEENATMLIAKDGNWTMSGEDYISGKYKIIDLKLK